MRQNRLSTVAFVLVAGSALGIAGGIRSALAAPPLPSRTAPNGFRSTSDTGGGRIVDGPLTGVTSSAEAFQAGLHRLGGYFDGAPSVFSAVRSRDGQVTLAMFQAKLHGTPITGLAITAFDPDHGARVATVFDTASRFPKTFKPLMARLQKLTPQAERTTGHGGGAAPPAKSGKPVPPLNAMPFADGTGSVSLPADWQPKQLNAGCVVALGPGGEKVLIGVPISVLDPNTGLGLQMMRMGGHPPGLFVPYVDDPAEAFQRVSEAMAQNNGGESQLHIEHATVLKPHSQTQITGTDSNNGVKMRFSGLVTLMPPGPQGGWLISLTMMIAPESAYYDDLPTLTAISRSYRYNNDAMMQRVNAWIAENARETSAILAARQKQGIEQIQETGQRAIQNARAVQAGIDRSAAGFIHYINDTNVVEYIPNGAQGTTSANLAQTLITQDPEHFREVPVSEYRPGTD